jgi:predicted NAD/FAD-binding protein
MKTQTKRQKIMVCALGLAGLACALLIAYQACEDIARFRDMLNGCL